MPKVIVKDANGKVVTEFNGADDEAIGTQAQDEGAFIPFSCGAGACRVCLCKVTKGMEHINKEAVQESFVETEDDEILSCIAGIKPGTPDDAVIEIEAENL